MEDRIAKQRLNIILLVDCSKSMSGTKIESINHALSEIKERLIEMQGENANVDFYLTIITFATRAEFHNGDVMKNVNDFAIPNLEAGGWSNLHFAYSKLNQILKKESNNGIMPDFGGIAPIILLMSDGHPTSYEYKRQFKILNKSPWFNAAIRYGIAIGINDDKTKDVLREFVGDNGEQIDCLDTDKLKNIIEIIVLTASKVKSDSFDVITDVTSNEANLSLQTVRQEIDDALDDIDEWECKRCTVTQKAISDIRTLKLEPHVRISACMS